MVIEYHPNHLNYRSILATILQRNPFVVFKQRDGNMGFFIGVIRELFWIHILD